MKNILKMFTGAVSLLTVLSETDVSAMQQQPVAFGHVAMGQQIDFVEQLIAHELNREQRPANFNWQLLGAEMVEDGVYLLEASFSDNHYYNNFPTSLIVFEAAAEEEGEYYYFVFVANEDNLLDVNSWGFRSVLSELDRFSNTGSKESVSSDNSGKDHGHDSDHDSNPDDDQFDPDVLYNTGCFNCISA